jgi:hypothetical protein
VILSYPPASRQDLLQRTQSATPVNMNKAADRPGASTDKAILDLHGHIGATAVLQVGARVILVDSPMWREWLADRRHTTFQVRCSTGIYRVLREQRNNGQGWYGLQRIGGKIRRVYIGRTPSLTVERLLAAGARLLQAEPPV